MRENKKNRVSEAKILFSGADTQWNFLPKVYLSPVKKAVVTRNEVSRTKFHSFGELCLDFVVQQVTATILLRHFHILLSSCSAW